MEMKIVGVALAAFVSLVVLAAVLIPVLDDATTTEETFTNDGIRLANVKGDSTHTIVWDHTDPEVITIDDNDIAMSSTTNPRGFVFGSENFFMKWYKINDSTIGVQFYSGSTRMDGNISSSKDMSVSVASGSVSVTAGSDTNTYSLGDHAYILDSTGDHVLKNPSDTVKVLGDTELVGIDTYQIASGYPAGVFVSGSVDDGLTYSAFFYNPDSVSFATPAISKTSVEGYKDLYDAGNLTVTATQGGTTKDLTATAYIVPLEVTAEKSVHLSDSSNALLSTIPVLIIVAIVLGIIAAVIMRR